MIQEIKCIITGRVQMVMFRDYVKRKAQALDLDGTVKNVNDGSVEVVAQGPRETLKELIMHLEKGPFLAHVIRVDVVWEKPRDVFSSFNIIY